MKRSEDAMFWLSPHEGLAREPLADSMESVGARGQPGISYDWLSPDTHLPTYPSGPPARGRRNSGRHGPWRTGEDRDAQSSFAPCRSTRTATGLGEREDVPAGIRQARRASGGRDRGDDALPTLPE